MTWVYKEYEVKMKVLQEQWLLLKKKFYQVIKWKLLFSGMEWTFGGGESTGVGKFLEQAGNVSKFWASRGTPPPHHSFSRRNLVFHSFSRGNLVNYHIFSILFNDSTADTVTLPTSICLIKFSDVILGLLEVSWLFRSEEKLNHVLKTDGDNLFKHLLANKKSSKQILSRNFKMELCLKIRNSSSIFFVNWNPSNSATILSPNKRAVG